MHLYVCLCVYMTAGDRTSLGNKELKWKPKKVWFTWMRERGKEKKTNKRISSERKESEKVSLREKGRGE